MAAQIWYEKDANPSVLDGEGSNHWLRSLGSRTHSTCAIPA